MAKAVFEPSGIADSLKPLVSGTRSSNDMRNALGALHQTDFAPLRARAQGFNTLTVFVNPAIVESYYMPVLNISGVPCTYPSGQSPTTWAPPVQNRVDVLHVNAAEPNPSLFWVSGTVNSNPTIPTISTSGTPIAAVFHRAGSTKILQTDDATNSYLYRDMRPLYSSAVPHTPSASNALTGSIVQIVNTQLTTPVDVTALVTVDDTPPLYSEGNQIGSLTITPQSATNKLIVRASFWGGANANGSIAYWLNDATGSDTALTVRYDNGAGATTENITASLEYYTTAGTTSPITFYLMSAVEIASTFYVGRTAGGLDVFGAAAFGSITIEEIKA